MLIIAGLAAALMIPVSLLVRRPPSLDIPRPAASPDIEAPSDMSVGEAIRSPQFIILLLTNFFCCATHSGPIFHTVSYALTCGIPMNRGGLDLQCGRLGRNGRSYRLRPPR